jgi:pyruvate dehydrogenase E1 component alpha subunit
MPGVTVDGNDPIEVYNAIVVAAERARDGAGPTLVECLTYRHGGHKRDDAATYRPVDEVEAWLARDPLLTFRRRLLDSGILDEAAAVALEEGVRTEVTAAVEFAQVSPDPAPTSVFDDVYA